MLGILLTCLLVLFELSYDIIKTIKISESHRFQLGATLGNVGGGVVFGDMGQTDGYILRISLAARLCRFACEESD